MRPATSPNECRLTSAITKPPLSLAAWGTSVNTAGPRPSTTPGAPPTLVLNGTKNISGGAYPRLSSSTPPASSSTTSPKPSQKGRLQRRILDQLQEDVKLTLLAPWEKMRGASSRIRSAAVDVGGAAVPDASVSEGPVAPTLLREPSGPRRPLPHFRTLMKDTAATLKLAAIGDCKEALPPTVVTSGDAEHIDVAELQAVLSRQKLGELKRRARQDGVDEKVLLQADDDADPKAFVIERILQQTSDRGKLQPSEITSLANKNNRPQIPVSLQSTGILASDSPISPMSPMSPMWRSEPQTPAICMGDEIMRCDQMECSSFEDMCETHGIIGRETTEDRKERELAAYQHAMELKSRSECKSENGCTCGFVFRSDSDANFCEQCGRGRCSTTVKIVTCICGAHLYEEANFCSKCGRGRPGIECSREELVKPDSPVAANPETPKCEDEDELLMEHMTQNEALGQMLSPHYVLISAEKDVMVSAVSLARMEANEEIAEKRRSEIPTGHSNALLSFVPKTLRRSIRHGLVHMEQWKVLLESPVKSNYEPVLSRFKGVLVFADASGFTKLTEALARQPQGAEKIGTTLNGFFCPVIELVEKYGGDIIKFSGDALSIVWASEEPAPGDEEGMTLKDRQTSEDIADGEAMDEEAVAQAAKFCIELQVKIPSFGKTPVPGCSLTMHIGVGFGKLALLQVGGLLGRWEYCVAGSALDQISIAEPLAASGETVFSPEAKLKACKNFKFEEIDAPLTPGFAKLRGCKTTANKPELKKTGTGRVSIQGLPDSVPSDFRWPEDFPPWWRSNLSGVDPKLVKRCVPSAVALRLASSPDAERVTYPEEMRRVSVVFVSIVGLDPASSDALPGDPRKIAQGRQTQLLMRLMQRSVYALEGSVNKFLVDDKGVLLLVAFGLPPLIHFTDDPVRAVLCAMRIADTLRDEGLQGQIGVATGLCWCGVVGNSQRREYTVLGDVVNLSARLMGKASVNNMLVDETTMKAGQQILDFESVGDVMLKGKADPVRVFKFIETKKGLCRHRKELRESLLSWKGWPAKMKLKSALENHRHKSGVIFITGPGGAGKTELAEQVKTFADENNWNLLTGQNMDPTGTFALPRLCLQEVFRELVDVASKEKYWRTQGWHLLLDSLQDDPDPEINAMRKQLRNRPRTGVATATEIYWILIAMIRQIYSPHEAADLEPWAPILSLVVTQLAFGPRMVSAMLERDEQHARNNRFGELCTAVIDGYSRWGGNNNKGTMILLHVRRSSAFFQNRDPQEAAVFRAIAELCMRRRDEMPGFPEARPLVLCIVSRESVLKDGLVLEKATECGGLVEAPDFTLQETFAYVQHMFDSIAQKPYEHEEDDDDDTGGDQIARLPSEHQDAPKRLLSLKGNGQIKACHRRRVSHALGSTWDLAQLNVGEDPGSRNGSLSFGKVPSMPGMSPSWKSRASSDHVLYEDSSTVRGSLEVPVLGPTVARRHSTFGVPGISEIIFTKKSSLIAEDAMQIIAEYVYEMTGGNSLGVEVMLKALERRGVLKPKDGHLDFAEPYMDAQYLRTSTQLPEELVGMAFGAFERLGPQGQSALKAATTLDRFFTRAELDAALSDLDQETRDVLISKLMDPDSCALVPVETSSGPKLRFYSGLLRFAASSLVLETQRSEVRRKTLATLDQRSMNEALNEMNKKFDFQQMQAEANNLKEEDDCSSDESEELEEVYEDDKAQNEISAASAVQLRRINKGRQASKSATDRSASKSSSCSRGGRLESKGQQEEDGRDQQQEKPTRNLSVLRKQRTKEIHRESRSTFEPFSEAED